MQSDDPTKPVLPSVKDVLPSPKNVPLPAKKTGAAPQNGRENGKHADPILEELLRALLAVEANTIL